MASEKRASEGIALLSMYGDEDDEMEDVDEEEENRHEEDIPAPESDAVTMKDNDGVSDFGNETMPGEQEETGLDDNSTPNKTFNYGTSSASATPQLSLFSPQQQQQQQPVGSDSNSLQSLKNRLTIVDYGHEEGAISPEPEEGEILAAGRVMYGEKLQAGDGEPREKKSPGIVRLPTPNTQATSPRSLEPNDQPELEAMNAKNESELTEIEDAVMVSIEEQKDVDPLDKFLPPPPKGKCSDELQEKIIKFLALKKTTGRSFNAEVRNRKEYRNPDFLLHAVTYQDIDQIGSCFSKDVFDPHGYDKSDFYDEIAYKPLKPKLCLSPASVLDIVISVLNGKNYALSYEADGQAFGQGLTAVATATSDVTARDGRQNKKSKWDKVDVDQRNSLATGGQENLSAVGAHAALLSAAKAGSGYSAFAIATDMKIKRVAVTGTLSLCPLFRTRTVDMAVYEAYLDNNIIPFKSFSSQSVLVDHSQNVIAEINPPAERKSCFHKQSEAAKVGGLNGMNRVEGSSKIKAGALSLHCKRDVDFVTAPPSHVGSI
ncbi:UNVERIFIED_CONTAM: SAP30-binding protein [Sesamum radiatum]|uniref:SAP30-binding protein n=1 Tax=Sesamum radiatum TaxID=300843 RepID=A0AAW2T270_SESRA